MLTFLLQIEVKPLGLNRKSYLTFPARQLQPIIDLNHWSYRSRYFYSSLKMTLFLGWGYFRSVRAPSNQYFYLPSH